MSYIGNGPVVGAFKKCDAITTSSTATYNLTVSSVAVIPQSANHCIVSLNGVIQAPTSAFTVSGSTIVFNSSLTSSDTIDFILILGDVLNVGTPSDDAVSTAKIADSAVTTAKIAADAITAAKIADDAISEEHLDASVITSLTALGATPADTDELLVSDAGTLKRVDYSHLKGGGAWNVVSAQTASNDSEIIFTNSHFTSTYDVYKVVISNMIPASDDLEVRLRYSQGGSYNTGSNYEWGAVYGTPNAHASQGYASHTYHVVGTHNIGNATGETYNAEVTIYNPLQTNNFKVHTSSCIYTQQNGSQANWSNSYGRFKTGEDTALDAFKFYMSSGNITSGLFVLYGLAKS